MFTDQYARIGMREFFKQSGLNIGAENVAEIYVNNRLYEKDGVNYRIPDLRVGDRFCDASISEKTLKNSQIRDFFDFGNPKSVTIVRPADVGTSYVINPPKE